MARKQTPSASALPTVATAAAAATLTLPAVPAADIVACERDFEGRKAALVMGWLDQCRAAGAKVGDLRHADKVKTAVNRALEDANSVAIDAGKPAPLAAGTIKSYAQGAARALYFGIPWTSSLHADKSRKLPGSKAAGSKARTLTRAQVDERLGAALEALRMFGLAGVAADVIDAIRKALPDWAEPASK